MNDAQSFRPWANFAGCVLVVAVMYWAQAVLIPLALAILLAFLLTPVCTRLQKWIGRVAAVIVTVSLTFTFVGLMGWLLANQVGQVLAEIPQYRANIREKVADIREAGKGPVETVQKALEEIQAEIDEPAAPAPRSRMAPVVAQTKEATSLWTFAGSLGPVLGPLTTAGLVIALVIFLLIERDNVRGRLIDFVGHGNLAVTTRAFDEAGRRVSRQLLMQTLVNAIYGAGAGLGLYILDVPFALLWGALGFVLRFAPYLGPLIAAAMPIFVGFAALPGWDGPLSVVGLFIVLELFTNLVLETLLYAGAAGVSPLALLLALAFWTWLWGPMGLLMGTPLTICLVVLGKHVPRMEFLSTLMAETPALPPDMNYYQRLLAHEPHEAADILERHLKVHPSSSVYDAYLLPALSYARRDRIERRLSAEEEQGVIEATRDLMSDPAVLATRAHAKAEPALVEAETIPSLRAAGRELTVLGWAGSDRSDRMALSMLGQMLEPFAISLDVLSEHALASELIARVNELECPIVCVASLPPRSSSPARYLVKRLRAACPNLTIVVGRWAPEALADEHARVFTEAGANHVSSSLIATRDQLRQLAAQRASASDRPAATGPAAVPPDAALA
jgi:predicted PurR-regulated permease PerM